LLHVAIGIGHPGGGIYPMGLCRESAEDVEHPTEFLLKAHSHVVELHQKKPRLPYPCRKVPTAVHTIGTAHAAPEVPKLSYA
jgi:hypothetical protein